MMNDVAARMNQQPDTVQPTLKARLAERKARWPADDKAREEAAKKRNIDLKETLFHSTTSVEMKMKKTWSGCWKRSTRPSTSKASSP